MQRATSPTTRRSCRCCWGRSSRSVELLAAGQHLDELRDPAGTCFRPLRLLDAVEDRVAVLLRERREELACLLVARECAFEVLGDDGIRRTVVRRVPAAVRL